MVHEQRIHKRSEPPCTRITNQILVNDQQTFLENMLGVNFLLPEHALRTLFVSKKALELATDPKQVKLVPWFLSPAGVCVLVAEVKPNPLSDEKLLEKHCESDHIQKLRFDLRESDVPLFEVENHLPPVPEGIDPAHRRCYNLVQAGLLTVNDYVMQDIRIKGLTGEEVYAELYWDRPELRGKGLAKSTYCDSLYPNLKTMGYRFFTGHNRKKWRQLFGELCPPNIDIYLQKLKRFLMTELYPAYRSMFSGLASGNAEGDNEFTVSFLRNEDIETFILPCYRSRVL